MRHGRRRRARLTETASSSKQEAEIGDIDFRTRIRVVTQFEFFVDSLSSARVVYCVRAKGAHPVRGKGFSRLKRIRLRRLRTFRPGGGHGHRRRS
jgi:hypothetical protein